MTITLTKEQFERHMEEERVLEIRRNPPEVMDVAEVAAFLTVHTDTIRHDFAAGAMPGHKRGRRVLFLRDEIRAWLKGRTSVAR